MEPVAEPTLSAASEIGSQELFQPSIACKPILLAVGEGFEPLTPQTLWGRQAGTSCAA